MAREDHAEIPKLENQVCFALYSLAREVTKLYHPILKEFGLTYTQYITMLALWEKDGVSVKELGERLHLDSGTLTPLLKRLEAMDLVARIRDKRDERSVRVTLTTAGLRLRGQAKDIPARLFECAGVTAEEAESLRDHVNQALIKLQGGINGGDL